jgi:hypothetical protein
MNKKYAILAIVATFLLAACASQPKVFTDFDPEQDFSEYKYFTWVSAKPMMVQSEYVISPLVEQRIMGAIISTMETKGYIFTEDKERADMAISFTIGARDKIRTYQEPIMFTGTNWRWGGQYWGMTGPAYTQTTRVYSQGTLAIDVMDIERKAPVWHGVSSKTLSEADKAASIEFVNAAVDVTLESFPLPN